MIEVGFIDTGPSQGPVVLLLVIIWVRWGKPYTVQYSPSTTAVHV